MEEIKFKGQKRGEKVLAIFRKSPLAFIKQYFSIIAILVISLVISGYFSDVKYLKNIFLIGIAFSFLIIFEVWFLWSRTCVFVTNKRVVVFIQEGIFEVHFYEAYLDSICQVGANIKGIFHSIFNFGRVLVQTQAELWLEDMADPFLIKEAIYNAIHQFVHKNNE